jgi:hypothetical protein
MINTMRDPAYLDFIRGRLCSFCFSAVVEPHHVFKHFRGISTGGIGRKGSDYLTLAVCRRCHDRIHAGNLRVERVELLELIAINLVCFVAGRSRRTNRGEVPTGAPTAGSEKPRLRTSRK